MHRTKTSTFFDYSSNQLVRADNNGPVHPGFTLPETQQEQQRRRELEDAISKTVQERQELEVAISKTVQETHQLQVKAQQIKQQGQAQSNILEGLTPEEIEALLEPWQPEQTTQV